MRFQVLEIGIIDSRGDLRIGVGYHHLGTDRVSWRTAEGKWQEGRLDPRGDCTILADLDDCDDLDHAERIFLGPWPKANRIADLASAPGPRSMYATEYSVVLDGPGYEIILHPTGEARVCVLVDNDLVDFECNTEAQAAEKLRELLALRGEHN